jgi:methyl-accepting chemotaxis protein
MNNRFLPNGKLTPLVYALGIAMCLAAIFYGYVNTRVEAGRQNELQVVAGEMSQLSRQISEASRASAEGSEKSISVLQSRVVRFDQALQLFDSQPSSVQIDQLKKVWEPVRNAAHTIIKAGPRLIFVHGIAEDLSTNIPQIQGELASVVEVLSDQRSVSTDTLLTAQNTLWQSERIGRNVDRILAGGSNSQLAADEFRSDSEAFIRSVEALTRGDKLTGVVKVSNVQAIEAVSTAFRLFSGVATSVDRIAESAGELQEAARARDVVADSGGELAQAVVGLERAVERQSLGLLADRDTVMTLVVAPTVMFICLLVGMIGARHRRSVQSKRGIAGINEALNQIAEGDLTVEVREDLVLTGDIAAQLNLSTARQRDLIRDIRSPFLRSAEEINKIGVSTRGQVEKGQDLTKSVLASTSAATEMVRASEEIKASSEEAARTSQRNSKEVATGYELTKDMSKASVDVRESLQETSKSAKRQGELIQSVTAAAEYIQALNTKISVVAINTRIEAEKAGEYGRPFLGIADSIADLMREAEEEGRKIISEVRTLQNMSGENLVSMENTVGTVVTILEYIDKLDSALEEINAGSTAISSIIDSVDDAAAKTAVSALHMNNSMAEMRQHNTAIGKFSESTQGGVQRLQMSMRDVSRSLEQFRIDADSVTETSRKREAEVEELSRVQPGYVYAEAQMNVLENAGAGRVAL